MSVTSSMLGSIDESNQSPATSTNGSTGVEVVSNTQYLDADMLAGLCECPRCSVVVRAAQYPVANHASFFFRFRSALGFGTPPITSSLKPFTGVIPNVIALPYGRCPPFHISAPSWRSMLRLMARLSGSRLEPTMEALAIVKSEMRLRVVISFVKVRAPSHELLPPLCPFPFPFPFV